MALKETGHSNQAVARRLNVSLATVATLYSRAKAKGYQVVLVLSGDPLNLYGGNEDEPPDDSGPTGPESGARGAPVDGQERSADDAHQRGAE